MNLNFKPLSAGQALPLTNGTDQIWLFFIGTGSAFAERHYQTNFLLVKGDTHILVDFGATGQRALLETARLKPTDIRCVLPTHSHADHVGGLECLALMNRYVGMKFMQHPKIKLVATPEYQRVLWDYTLRGGLEWNEKDLDSGQRLGLHDFFDVITPTWKTNQPREIWSVDVGPIHLELFRTKHIPEGSGGWQDSFLSYGMVVDGKVFISADSRFDPDLIQMYPHCEAYFHDVQFFPGAVHAPLADLKSLPPEIKQKMFLMHYADNFDKQDISGFAGWTEQGIIYEFAGDHPAI